MKYKISKTVWHEIETEDGQFVATVIQDGATWEEVQANRKQLEATARRIVTALNSVDAATIHIQHTLENAQAAGLCN